MSESDRETLPQRQSKLSPAKRALLARWKRGEPTSRAADSRIPHRPDPESAPLSFAQQRLWFLSQLDSDSPAYNQSALVRLVGELDREALARAFTEIVARHEVLRTAFAVRDEEPRQRIVSRVAVPLPVVALCRLAPEVARAEAERLIRAAARQPFDLARPPLLRTLLVRLERDEHLLLLSMHHIVTDGWSDGILIRELGRLYQALLAEQPSPLPPLPVQYADFAHWQRQWLCGPVLAKLLAYWTEQLAGPPPVLELPCDRPRPAVQGVRGARFPVRLEAPLTARLKELGREQETTLFMKLLAALQLLLGRITGQRDLAVGSPVANRSRSDVEKLIGFFVNTLVLRADLRGDASRSPSFLTLLDQVRRVTLGAYAHQELPFGVLVEELSPERDLSHSPLFQVLFALQNAPGEPLELPGLTLHLQELDDGTAKFDLSLYLTERDQGLHGFLEYNVNLFDRTTVARFIGQFRTLLQAATLAPEQQIVDLPLLSAAERFELVAEWNDTAVAYPSMESLHQLIEAQVARTPDAVAVTFEDHHLSYWKLNCRSNQLAHELRSVGVGPETRVGICAERCPEMVVGLLGILKAGGAYVPLDPTYPRGRLAFMLKGARAPVLLVQKGLLSTLPSHRGRMILLDADQHLGDRQSPDNPPPRVSAENLAYVIYTSGSTGQPKGSMLSHRGIVNRLLWMQEAYGLQAGEAVLQKTPFSFDVSVWEFFWPLIVGARLVVARPGGHQDGWYLAELIAEQRVTTLHFVPSMLQIFLKEPRVDECCAPPAGPLKRVIVSGEALPYELRERFYARLGAQLHNLYGPTEASVDVTFWACERDGTRRSVPIGRPIGNIRIHVLDRRGNLVPLGAPGELCIAGCGLARGYLERPDLTAERFVPAPHFGDPLCSEPGSRLYRTGDQVRYRGDGAIEFLGRLDHQVKLHGLRIELGEIEAVLEEHPAVHRSVVVVRGERLVGYVAHGREHPPAVAQLRTLLQERLPGYMVPAALVFLEALPLTPSGKIDRRALPAPEGGRPESGEGSVSPRTPVEELLVAIWADLLGRERVGVHDNFFDLGGHSLLATQLVSRIRKAFGAEVPLRRLFEVPTAAGLAREIELGSHEDQAPLLVPLPRDDEGLPRDAVPLSFAQQRLWIIDQLEPGDPSYNIPAALRLRGRLEAGVLEACLGEVLRRHESLRTSFAAVAGGAVQVVAPARPVTLPEADLRALAAPALEREARRLALREVLRPFDLSRGPLLRARLLRLAEDESLLLVTMHHVISDAWSLGILIRELASLYRAFRKGDPSPLPELEIQYPDFARWQRQWLQGEVLERQLAYWTAQLADPPPPLRLPADRPRPAVWVSRGALLRIGLPAELAAGLRSFSRARGATLYMTLLGALGTLLGRYAGEDDVRIGSPIAHRGRSEIEGLIGFFVNTLVMRADLRGDPSFCELLDRVRRTALDAYAHQDLPFELLVDKLAPERDRSRTPLFQVAFGLQNVPMPRLELPEVTPEPQELDPGTAKFDLTLNLEETEDALGGWWEYSTELFDAATIVRMAGHYLRLLEGIVERGERRLGELPLLGEGERQQLLVEWNDTRSEFPRETSIPQLVELRAERMPDAVAVVFDSASSDPGLPDERLSYRELNRQANQLAHRLRSLGVGPDVLVGICLERSVRTVVGILGILKAGGAYLPLDPSYPAERLAFMLEDAGAPVLITDARLAATLPATIAEGGVEIVCLDRDAPEIARHSDRNPESVAMVGAENLAYVIYTSGSTGRPKGTELAHAGLLNLLAWHQDLYRVTAADRATHLAGPGFDAAVWELWPYLTAGAAIHIPEREIVADPQRLVRWLAAAKITLCFLPTPLAEAALTVPLPPGLGLRALLTGGDRLHRYPDRHLPFTFLNHYGPTENTVVTTWTALAPQGPERAAPPIGRPLPNVRVYLLDADLRPVPIGVVGELHIAGSGLARGYARHPRMTAERFVPNPFGAEPGRRSADLRDAGARLYRTGDLARYRPDGNVEFLGRIDHQVKIRGIRIELGEIEAALAEHPAVRQVAVVQRPGPGGTQRLVAYAECAGEAPGVGELRRFLGEKLPEYMVPATFVFPESLPMNPSGKISRRELPDPDPSRPELDDAPVAPRTPVEGLLTRIWAQVLSVEEVGVHDNFFDLGGDSILAIQLVTKAGEAGLRLSPGDLFEAQTIAELAAVAGEVTASSDAQGAVTGEVALTPIQYWFFGRELPEPHHFNQAVLLEVPRPLDPRILERTLAALVEHHDALRLRFFRDESGWRQRNAPADGAAPLVRIDLSALAQEPRAAALAQSAAELQGSLELGRGPLLRMALFDLGPDEAGRLLWMIHHLAVDGVSWRVLLEDFDRVYRQIERGEQVALPGKTESFRSWAGRLAALARSPALSEELAYWLDPSRARVEPLPVDLPGGANTVASQRTVTMTLQAAETRSLLREVPAAYHTQINDVLLTALVEAFAAGTGTGSLLVDLEGHGREELVEGAELSRTVGWFTAMYPVLLDLGDAWDPGEELKAIKEQLRAVPGGGIGWGLLRYLHGDGETRKRLASLPAAEVSFNYLGQLDPTLQDSSLLRPARESGGPATGSGGLRAHLLEIDGGISDGCLRLRWSYSENLHRRATVEGLAAGYLEALRALIDHCLSPEAGGHTPADFPEARLGQKDLDKLFARIKGQSSGVK